MYLNYLLLALTLVANFNFNFKCFNLKRINVNGMKMECNAAEIHYDFFKKRINKC